MGRPAQDYNTFIGLRKGKMVITSIVGRVKKEMRLMGRCDCGIEKEVSYSNFILGRQLSCGCNRTPKTAGYDVKHPLYKVWIAFRARCKNTNDKGYCNYGGRGVTVCEEWDMSYLAFYTWAINNGYKAGLHLDKDIKGGMMYSPETCSFVTQAENNRNRTYRNKRKIPIHRNKQS